MNVKIVGSWKNDEKGEMLFDNLKNHKNDSWSKKKQWIKSLQKKRKKVAKKIIIIKEKEIAGRKSQ